MSGAPARMEALIAQPSTAAAVEAGNGQITAARQPTLWLARHVHVCRVGSHVIGLDLVRDRYVGFSGSALEYFSTHVAKWPNAHASEPYSAGGDSAQRPKMIEELIAQGIFTSCEHEGKDATPVSLPLAHQRALTPNTAYRRFTARDAVHFLRACSWTAYSLRRKSFFETIESLRARKEQFNTSGQIASSDLTDLIALFRRMRSFTFPAREHCLFHAITLLNYLACSRIFPQLVIGVRLNPWTAHAWVQSEEFVLDSTPEQVRFYTPILVI